MSKFIVCTLILGLSASAFAKTVTQSAYTDMKTDCIVVSSATDKAPIDFYTSECKSFGGYSLKESGGDLRYGPELSYQGQEIDLQRPPAFHQMGSQKIEWVYDLTQDEEGSGEIKFKALIYRLGVATNPDSQKDESILYVVKLDGKNSCIIGKTSTNELARKLANDKNAKCVTLDYSF